MFRSTVPLAAVLLLAGCRTGEESASRPRLEQWWQLYQQGSSSWPEARTRWYELGGDDRDTLVLSLIRQMVAMAPQPVRTEGGLEPGWKRPQRELLALPAEGCVPLLEEALRAGRDHVSLEALADTLAGFGAVDSLASVLDAPRPGDTKEARRHAVVGLVKAGGERAISRVGARLRGEADWSARASAADALGNARYADRGRAATALIAGLEDEDPFVVRKVCQALAKLEVRTAAPALALRYARARRDAEEDVAGWTVEALRHLTGERVAGDDPSLWRQAADRAAARGG